MEKIRTCLNENRRRKDSKVENTQDNKRKKIPKSRMYDFQLLECGHRDYVTKVNRKRIDENSQRIRINGEREKVGGSYLF